MYEDLVKCLRERANEQCFIGCFGKCSSCKIEVVLRQAADLIEALDDTISFPLYRASYWTPVSEETPRLTGQYLVATENETVYAYWDWEENQWYGLCGTPLQGVTFWMEFPEPPTIDTEEQPKKSPG